MTMFTVTFQTEAQWAELKLHAPTPDEALERARPLAETDADTLDFQAYDEPGGVEHIEVFDPDGLPVAEWQNANLLMRLAASELLAALRQAVTALNSAPRFPVPALLSDSYRIASFCDRAITKAETGAV